MLPRWRSVSSGQGVRFVLGVKSGLSGCVVCCVGVLNNMIAVIDLIIIALGDILSALFGVVCRGEG
mgnify:CR=1 FL=1|tara:strand:+ start:667 stop:864 length:198 start_codon:yes stop_codon:yes gene_type:complete